ncbi:MAG: hypothetical protein VX670_11510, partial [Candidatus Latescibacterota bacterium]|nr:hypothetical protein [Candidatus Latescibacterota bacterium]
MAGRREIAAVAVDGEGNDIVAPVAADDQVGAGRVEAEVARALAAGGHDFDSFEIAVVAHGIDGDRVMTAVGAVDEFAVGMDVDIGGVAGPGIAVGQGRDRRASGHRPGMLIEVEGGNGISHLVDDVEAPVAWMICQVARTLTGLDAAGLLRGEFARFEVYGIDHNFVETEVRG